MIKQVMFHPGILSSGNKKAIDSVDEGKKVYETEFDEIKQIQ